MVEVAVVGRARLRGELRASIRIGDDGGAQASGRVLGRSEVGERVRVRLDEQDLAVRAHGRGHIEVERDLLRPSAVRPRYRRRAACLVDLGEAPGPARREPVRRAICGEIRRRGRRVVRVDDREGLAAAGGRARQAVGGPQVGGAVAVGRRGDGRSALGVGDDAGVAVGEAGGGVAAHVLVGLRDGCGGRDQKQRQERDQGTVHRRRLVIRREDQVSIVIRTTSCKDGCMLDAFADS